MFFPWKAFSSLCFTRAILQSATHEQITCNLGQSWLRSAARSSSSLPLTAALPDCKLGFVKWAPKTQLFLVSADKWTQVASTLSAEFNSLQLAQEEGTNRVILNWLWPSSNPNCALQMVQQYVKLFIDLFPVLSIPLLIKLNVHGQWMHTTTKVTVLSRLWCNFQENVKCFSIDYRFKEKKHDVIIKAPAKQIVIERLEQTLTACFFLFYLTSFFFLLFFCPWWNLLSSSWRVLAVDLLHSWVLSSQPPGCVMPRMWIENQSTPPKPIRSDNSASFRYSWS